MLGSGGGPLGVEDEANVNVMLESRVSWRRGDGAAIAVA